MNRAWLISLVLVVGVLGSASVHAGDARGPAVTLTPVGAAPSLQVARPALITVRISNDGPSVVPGATAADYARGKPAVYVGAWFADRPPRVLGTFQHSVRLDAPLEPGRSIEVTLQVEAVKPGSQFLGIGLFRAALDPGGNGPVGEVLALPVVVTPGSWLDNARTTVLRVLMFVHIAGFAASLVMLWRWTRSP